MKHSVVFKNQNNKWDNALPIGNGIFGGMLFFEDGKLNMPMNHYEVYYNIRFDTIPSSRNAEVDAEFARSETLTGKEREERYGAEYKQWRKMAEENQTPEGEPFGEYRISREAAVAEEPAGMLSFASSFPVTGELQYSFDPTLDEAEEELTLHVEDAEVNFSLKNDDNQLSMRTIATRKDCHLQKVVQSREGLLQNIRFLHSPMRNQGAPRVTYEQVDDNTFTFSVIRNIFGADKPFHYAGVVKLVGAKGSLTPDKQFADIAITESEREFYIMTAVFTDFKYANPTTEGVAEVNAWAKDIPTLEQEHAEYWSKFFEQSSITLPDTFLEHVYYVNLYAFDSCSGKDGIMKHQACGLNGLWDVRRPVLWGSKWYWDANIQASFAGVFTGNRLELGKVFFDGLLSYTKLAEHFALMKHDLPGAALDYPYLGYYCIMPWCAQYLWFQYEYSQDKEYLRTDAYPLFLKLSEFAINRLELDEKSGKYMMYPDISPEQGPLAHNTTITIACIRFLLYFTMKSAEILGDSSELLDRIKAVYEKLPEYKVSGDGFWGPHLMDSWDAHENMWLRHPSLLMPLYPIGEYDPLTCDEETRQMLSNTVDYMEDQTEYGVFQGSWVSAAASRVGRGNAALRILYERGIDHMLRSNGLTAEETDHFINFCLTTRQPLYYPCMMEFTGEMLAAVHEMLLQSYNGIIRVFPAIPDDVREWGHLVRHGRSLQEYQDRHVDYMPWTDVRFDKLLAAGAFEVTAELKDSKLHFIQIHSKAGGDACIYSPYLTDDINVYCDGKMVTSTYDGKFLRFHTDSGKDYLIAESASVDIAKPENADYCGDVLERTTYTKRRISIGENADTIYYKALDYSIRDWFIGNSRQNNHTVYKFDFGTKEEKLYTKTMPRIAFVDVAKTLKSLPYLPIHDENMEFTHWHGYGFSNTDGITMQCRDMDDLIRRDFMEGEKDTEFLIEVPRGQYELLVISGDQDEESLTRLGGSNGFVTGGKLMKKGSWQCERVPFYHEKDGALRLKISTEPGKKWKINAIYMNWIKGF